jgi:hypothetical protein
MATPTVDLREQIKEEYKRCLADPQYFIRHHCKIQHPLRGRINFDLYQYQEHTIKDFDAHRYNIILKGRQIGISTVVACYALWLMLFHRDKNILVIATKQDTAKNLITKVRFAFDNLPIYLQVPCIENNKLSLKFKNGSHIKAATAAEDSGRSEALSLLILDEAAFIKNAEDIWLAALPTLSTGGQAVLISTPNGMGNFFHRKYSEAIQEVDEVKPTVDGDTETFKFHPIKLDWRVHPERDQAWRDKMGRLQGEREARQEFDAEFIGSGNTVIDGDLIELYAKEIQEPIRKAGFDGNLWIWEECDRSKKYIVVADVSRGDGQDFDGCHVIELESNTQVAEYKGKMPTTQYGHFLVELSTSYNDAILVIERENVGWSTIQTVIDREYKNLFYMSKDRKLVDVHRTVTNRYRSDDKQMVAGFGTTISTRPLIINKLDMYMRERLTAGKSLNIRSLRLIEELRVFIWNNGKAQAQDGYNDDLIIPLGIALWVRDVALKMRQEGIELSKSLLNSIQRTGGDTSIPDGVYMPGHMRYDPYTLPISRGNLGQGPQEDEDMRWLLG